ncbi:ScbR family autoregulator-binding transcription factor [Microbacterium sp.]|uniref:ScbR family autoregulator-binding transcription factor n=1 Tax=Microbacterium sp. TaxID=51671 RepID=UPI0032214AF5
MTMQARAQQTRRTIIEAAADAFVTRGFAGASLAEIADQAGVTKGALYFHFPSKAALASAMIEVQREANAELAERVDAYEGDRLELLVDLTRALGRRLVDDATLRAAMRLAVERGEVEDAVISETYTRWEQLVAEVVRAAKERREVAGHIDPERFARFLVAAFTGLQTVSLVESGLGDLDDRVEDMWMLLRPGLTVG